MSIKDRSCYRRATTISALIKAIFPQKCDNYCDRSEAPSQIHPNLEMSRESVLPTLGIKFGSYANLYDSSLLPLEAFAGWDGVAGAAGITGAVNSGIIGCGELRVWSGRLCEPKLGEPPEKRPGPVPSLQPLAQVRAAASGVVLVGNRLRFRA